MECKFCGAHMEPDDMICPACGEKNLPEKKATVNIGMVIGATVVCVLLLVVLAGAIIYGITGKLPYNLGAKETTAATDDSGSITPTEESLAGPEDLGMSIAGVTDIALYAVDEAAAVANADTVIAQIGDYKLTNGLLQTFYYMEFNNFLMEAEEDGYDLAGSYNLDVTKPMGEQLVVGSTVTWEQFFLHNALGAWWRYVTVNTLADEAGFTISATDRTALDAVPAQLEADAAEAGLESADALVRDRLGAGCDLEDYIAYMELTARGDLYYTEYQETYTPTAEEVKEFYDLNADYYSYYGITEESGKMAAVRHVLLVPEGAEKDESTGHVTATDAQWAAGEQAAQAMLDAWVAEGATEEGFAALANAHSTDSGSNTTGGLYEGVLTGQMVENFDAWVFDEARKSGDYGIVRTEFGHHLMYFVSLSENDAWYEYACADAISYGYGFNKLLSDRMNDNKLEPSLEKIALTDVAFEASQTQEEVTPTETAG